MTVLTTLFRISFFIQFFLNVILINKHNLLTQILGTIFLHFFVVVDVVFQVFVFLFKKLDSKPAIYIEIEDFVQLVLRIICGIDTVCILTVVKQRESVVGLNKIFFCLGKIAKLTGGCL